MQDNANYTYHFNRTNASELGSNKVVGGDYYFKYGNSLLSRQLQRIKTVNGES